MVDAVFFDIGSTLMYASPSVPEMLTLVASERGHAVALADVERFMPVADEFYEREYLRDGDFWCSHERATQIWRGMYRLLADSLGLEDDARGISEEMHRRYRAGDSWALYDDVVPCLRTLKQQGYRLGVISNWDADLESLLRDVGLLPYFDEVVVSSVVGYRKPDPVMFQIALERMGVEAARTVHVGDLPEADGAAAQVGITPVILDRGDVHEGCSYARIRSLGDLPPLLEGRRHPAR